LPLTVEPHEKANKSILSDDMPEKPIEGRGSQEEQHDEEEITLRGLLNLFVLLLATYNYRFVI
jgi:hypothetical protein